MKQAKSKCKIKIVARERFDFLLLVFTSQIAAVEAESVEIEEDVDKLPTSSCCKSPWIVEVDFDGESLAVKEERYGIGLETNEMLSYLDDCRTLS